MVVIGKEMRAAVKFCTERDEGIMSYPFHSPEPLLAGDYDLFDLWDMYDEEAFGVLPPIGYEEGSAL